MPGDEGNDYAGQDHHKRKFAALGVMSLMLVAVVVAVVVGVKGPGNKGGNDGGEITATTRAVDSICQPTDYRQACVKALSNTNSSDPQELIQAAFNAAMEKIEGALKNSSTIKAAQDDPRTAGALETCKEVMEYAISDLNRSISQMGEFDFSKLNDYVGNMRIWLSGAVTFQETCIDAFENTTGNAGEEMKKMLNSSRQLTSNGLAMATQLSSFLSTLNISGLGDIGLFNEGTAGGGVDGERKLTEDFPHWADMRQRQLLETPGSTVKADVVVAKDGSGKFKTITEALKQVPTSNTNNLGSTANKTFVIYIKAGIYEEEVRVEATMNHVMFVGDGPTKTKITGRKSFADGFVTYKTATVSIMGSNFMAKDIGFENSAGAEKHQAVALLVQSDMSIFYNCQMDGYQDTLCANSYRQFYRDCTISGTIDYVFGDAAAVFQNCKFIIRKPLDGQQCTVMAHGRTDHREATGFVLQNCTITGDKLYLPLKDKNKAFLGRPWKMYSRAVVMQSSIDDSIAPGGWEPWTGNFGIDTCTFSEYENKGPGAAQTARVKWPGIKKITTAQEASQYTPGKFIGGDKWITPTGVPYVSGMVSV